MIMLDRPSREDYPAIERKEVIKYLGGSRMGISPEADELLNRCISEISSAAEPRACYARFPVVSAGEGMVKLSCMEIPSKALSRHVSGCTEAILFAATIGPAADRRIRAAELVSPSRAAVLQAAGAAAVEAYCDDLDYRITMADRSSGRKVLRRFSPGYGDFPLECQKDFFSVLQCTKYTGITLTEGMLMIPTKSVTAFIGIV